MLKEEAVTAVTAPFCMPGSACPALHARQYPGNHSETSLSGH